MRAVVLGNEDIQKKIAESFVPVKAEILPGTKHLPISWPALRQWSLSYWLMGGEKSEGFTCCTIISPDLKTEYGNTGSAFVWEMFDSIAYDSKKFGDMLDRSVQRSEHEQSILNDGKLSAEEKENRLEAFREKTKKKIRNEGRFRFPPKGFTIHGAMELFRMTGDLEDK